jgi:two-component system cell cycle sensor histidine kinase/response regulator CckA
MVDLRQIVEESFVLMKFQIRESRTTMRTVLPPEPVFVMADGAQLKQVLMNLVINALHAMEATPDPVLTITVDRRNGSGALTVSDNGPGIPPEIMGRIFDPFFTTKGPDKGSGLGLSICFSIVRKHNGDITVESEPGSGASFTVTMPIAVGESSAAAPAPETSCCPLPANELAHRRVLVVEDEEVLRKLKQEIIRSHFGCSVDVAANGAEGLALAAQGGYNLIISDIRMPEINGIELYLRLRELQPDLAKRFLFVSGHAGDKQIDTEVKRWNVPLVAKPFSVTNLIEACVPFLRSAEAAPLSA